MLLRPMLKTYAFLISSSRSFVVSSPVARCTCRPLLLRKEPSSCEYAAMQALQLIKIAQTTDCRGRFWFKSALKSVFP